MKSENYIKKLIDKGILPGISILVGQKDRILYKQHFGYKSLFPEKAVLAGNEVYDVASITKPLITAFLLVSLLEEAGVKLNESLRKFFPYLDERLQILHLLTHTSGYPAWFPFYLFGHDYLTTLKQIPLSRPPSKRVEYSCVGYIILFFLIEKISGAGFSELGQELILSKKNLKQSFLKVPPEQKQMAVPTETGNIFEKEMAKKKFRDLSSRFRWREHVICGETHDVNSHFIGGTAGNSGLFSTCEDLFRISLEFFPSTASILNPDSIELFWKNFTPWTGSHRSIGFKLNSSMITSGGRSLSPSAIGHNGFTGTSLWLEPVSEYKFIILSNRIHPQVNNQNFNRIRRKLHSMIISDLGLK